MKANILEDNMPVISLIKRENHSGRTKHLDVQIKYIIEAIVKENILVEYISTERNLADILTKQSVGPQFRLHRNYILGMTDTIDLQVEAKYAHITMGKARRRQLKRKRILARQECDDLVKF